MGENWSESGYEGWGGRHANAALGNESTEIVAGVLANVQNLTGRGWNESALAYRAFRDLCRIVGANGQRLSNLVDEADRYEFWKTQGVYENYTARERAFLNKAVLPGILSGLVSRGREAMASASLAGLSMLSSALKSVAPDLADALAMFRVRSQYPGFFNGGRSGGAGSGRGWSESEGGHHWREGYSARNAVTPHGGSIEPPWRLDPILEPKKDPTPVPWSEDTGSDGKGSGGGGHNGEGSYSTRIRLTK
jgi:hypothetical protein